MNQNIDDFTQQELNILNEYVAGMIINIRRKRLFDLFMEDIKGCSYVCNGSDLNLKLNGDNEKGNDWVGFFDKKQYAQFLDHKFVKSGDIKIEALGRMIDC